MSYKHPRLYNIWSNIKARCNKKTNRDYINYGGRGIKLYEEWNNYKPFSEWAYENGYDETLSIDRIDNDGDYSPNNCRWTTRKVQNNNTRANIRTVINGVERTLAEHSEAYGIPKGTLRYRYHSGYRDVELLKTVKDVSSKVTEIEGVERSIKGHSDYYGVGYDAVLKRYHKGVKGLDLVKPSRKKKGVKHG